MKTYDELNAAYVRGEVSFEQYMTEHVEPGSYKVPDSPRRGRRAAKKAAALINNPYISTPTPAEEVVLESNSLCEICGREAVGYKSLCCSASVITPTEYAQRAQAGRTVRLTSTSTQIGYTVTIPAEGGKGTLKAWGNGEDGKPIPERAPVELPAPQKFVNDMVAMGWAAAIERTLEGNEAVAKFGRTGEQPATPLQSALADEEGAYVAAPGNLKTADSALKFILAGNAYFTVRSMKTGTRYTFRVALASVKENCTWCRRTPCTCKRPYFVSFLSGADNTSDYTYLGMVTDSVFRITRASQRLAESTVFKAFDYVYRHLVRRELPPQTEIWHEGRCGVCGRPLTVPASIESGIGPVCAGKEGM